MHSTFFLTLLFIDAAVNCGLLPSNKAEELVQDGNNDVSKIAVDDGKGAVKLIGRGYVDLVVSSDSIFVGVNLDKCNGKVLFFYAAKSGKMMEAAKNLCRAWPGSCGFQLKGTSDNITFTRDTFTKSELVDCKNDVEIKMKYNYAKYCNRGDASCTAVISPEDGRIGIHVEYTSNECPVTIKYAKIYVPPTTTLIPSTALPSMAKSSNGTITKNEDSAADASSQQLTWIILGCLIGVIVLGLIGGILLCRFKKWCMFKKKAAETLPPPVESIVSTTVTTKADENVTVEEKPKEEMAKVEKPEIVAAASKKKKSFTCSTSSICCTINETSITSNVSKETKGKERNDITCNCCYSIKESSKGKETYTCTTWKDACSKTTCSCSFCRKKSLKRSNKIRKTTICNSKLFSSILPSSSSCTFTTTTKTTES